MSASSVVFVPHGSPMFALEPGAAGVALRGLAQQIGHPKAIVVLSPHWETDVPTVGLAEHPDTIYDFGGFDPRLYDIVYPVRGAPEIADHVVALLSAAGLPVAVDPRRGLDHGAWVPLRHMYPDATIPVVPISLQPRHGVAHAFYVGKALSQLRDYGILIVASGNITHNLTDWHRVRHSGQATPDYVREFADWVHAQILAGNTEALLNYRTRAASGALAHPEEEHLLPLFTALGAAGPSAKGLAFYRGISDHVIAMDGYRFH